MYNYYPIDDEYFGVGSVNDCTGLIPAGMTDEDELDSYEEVYRFLPPDTEYYDDQF